LDTVPGVAALALLRVRHRGLAVRYARVGGRIDVSSYTNLDTYRTNRLRGPLQVTLEGFSRRQRAWLAPLGGDDGRPADETRPV
jgi:hypothetical protein